MTNEIWKPVVGFEGAYEVSNLGRVRSLPRVLTSTAAKRGYPRPVKGRLLKPQRHSQGYQQVSLSGRIRLVHSIVLDAFVGPCPAGMEGCHNNGDKWDGRLENLRYDTHPSNCEDRRRHGFCVRGEENPMAKLTEPEIGRIRAAPGTQKAIAADFDVSDRTIGKIQRRERWTHV